LANAYLQTDQASKAVDLLYKASKTEQKSIITKEILWYYHLALLKNNEIEAAKKGFQNAANETGPYKTNSQQILEELEAMDE